MPACKYETSISEAWVQVSAINHMLRKLRPSTEHPQPAFSYLRKVQKAA